ncbi:F-box only protein 5 [Periophthalmus magnuspinnatus]|uniref:F-box only protein 5 n=1 Tax=Periophthalmus magnuspinnatus TaxID=409849 RepID=UPI00145B3910|nr:F-box only protein 5 [Periophthalmus magnuspinnatus]
MTCHKKANMKVPSYEPSWPNTVEKSSAVDRKDVQLHGSPVKEPVVFKAPLPTVDVAAVHPQNNYTRAVHNKENAASRDHDRTMDQGLEDSGYLSLHNSHIEEEDENIHGTVLSAAGAVYQDVKHVTPKPSPTKCQERSSSRALFTPIDFHKKRNDTCSMSSTPADHHNNNPNLPVLRFKQAVCAELSKSFQKNKRYDWTIIPKLAEDYNLDRVIGGHMGVDHIDMFSGLLSRNMRCILVQILALLGDMDLISCRKVSRTWRKIINEDSKALKRCQKAEKAMKESEFSRRLASGLTRDVGVSRVVLSSMQRVATSSSSPAPLQNRNKENASSLKTCTPNYTRFNQYVEAASTLKQHESLRPCKRCGSPATHSHEAQRATCIRPNCQFDFCTCCREAFHGSTPCRVIQPRLHVSKSSTLLPGSARSKRNVRRL